MKWMIASDIHGSLAWCVRMREAFEREKADRLLLLGDLLYHGPRNDLPEGYDPKGVAACLNGMKDRILCVRGNCDTEVDQMVLEFPVMAEYALLTAGDRLVFATHGHHFREGALPPLQKGDILLHGHTHVPSNKKSEGIRILNPGSVAIPKKDSVHGYMTLENGLFLWKDLQGLAYDRFEA